MNNANTLSIIYHEKISESDVETMPQLLKRISNNIQILFRRHKYSTSSRVSGNGKSVVDGNEVNKVDRGKGKLIKRGYGDSSNVIPELAHLVDATPLNPRLVRRAVPFNSDLQRSPKSRAVDGKGKTRDESNFITVSLRGSTSLGEKSNIVHNQNLALDRFNSHPDAQADFIADHSTLRTRAETPPGTSTLRSHIDNSYNTELSYAINPDGEPYTLLPPTPPSNPLTPETHARHLESTLERANRLVRSLHAQVDEQRECIIAMANRLHFDSPESASFLIGELHAAAAAQAAEIADLKIALDFGNKLLRNTYRRQWDLWRWVEGLSRIQREERRRKGVGRFFTRRPNAERGSAVGLEGGGFPDGFEWENFGHGPDPMDASAGMGEGVEEESGSGPTPSEIVEASSAVLTRSELAHILSMAEENVRTLKEGVAEMVALVLACKGQATGIQEPEEREM